MGKKKLYKMKSICDPTLSRGVNTKNMIENNGILEKRNGWRVIGEFKDDNYMPMEINGIYEFKGRNFTPLIIHAGNKLYRCSYDLQSKVEIPMEYGILLKNQKSTGVIHKGLLWLGGMGELLVYDGASVKRVYESGLTYVPTTTVGITETQLGIKPQKNESVNLLTRKRKNSLRGQKTEQGSHFFQLDAKAKYGQPFKINACFRVKRNEEEINEVTTGYVGVNSAGEEVNTVVYIEIYVSVLENKEIESSPVCYDANGNVITVKHADFRWKLENGRDLTLYFNALTPQLNEDNITVEFVEDVDENRALDGVCVLSSIQDEKGESTVLLSCGNGRVYYSSSISDSLYFPVSNIIKVGQENKEVTAIFPMLNGYIGVFKKNSFYRIKINTDVNGEYRVYPSSDTRGCFSPHVAKSLEYDCLALNEDGVFGTSDTDNAEVMTTRLCNRSCGLQRELSCYSEKDGLDAVATVHKGQYYLFIGGRVYISGKKTGKSTSTKDFEYEWWVWEGCPCNSVCSAGGMLYMGRLNGDVATFDNEYTDRQETTLSLHYGDYMLEQNDNAVVIFNDGAGISNVDKVRLDTHYVYAGCCSYSPIDWSVSVPSESFFDKNGNVALYDGMWVKLTDSNGEVIYHDIIKATDPAEGCIYCGDLGYSSNTSVHLYLERGKETEYTLSNAGEGFTLLLDNKEVVLFDLNVERIFLSEKKAVECELSTPVTDLETDEKKTLYGIELILSDETRCKINIGYETKHNSFEKSVIVGDCLDFNSLDFTDFGFNSMLRQSTRINCLERQLDYIKIRVKSSKGGKLGIHDISLIYSVVEHIKK
ncbi:MAG: hypothetical protein E7596_00285 [Ruminococcaceae bacterium]|nr:hypothetical protein [Oscillospiraceae bacterium]